MSARREAIAASITIAAAREEPANDADDWFQRPLEFCGCGKLTNPIRSAICEQLCPAAQRAGGGTYTYAEGWMRWTPADPHHPERGKPA